MDLSPAQQIQVKQNLMTLHHQLGDYEDYLRASGFEVSEETGQAEEGEAIRVLCEGIEKRIAKMP